MRPVPKPLQPFVPDAAVTAGLGAAGVLGLCILAGALLIGCLADYQEQYRLRPDGSYKPLPMDTAVADSRVENTAVLCQDKADNDEDGFIDCRDSDCKGFLACNPTENTLPLCKDGLDNDGDALVDCKDPDCKDLYVCSLPSQDTVFVVDYKTTGRLSPVLYGTKAPRNLTWYFNGGDAVGGDALGLKGIVPGRSEEVTSCDVEPRCRKVTFTGEWGIAFTLFFKGTGEQDTVDMSAWMAASLKLSVKTRVTNLRLKLESRHLADVQEIPLSDLGFDPDKDTWQDLVVPLSKWTTQQKLSTNRLPFSIWKPVGPGGEVLIENIRWE